MLIQPVELMFDLVTNRGTVGTGTRAEALADMLNQESVPIVCENGRHYNAPRELLSLTGEPYDEPFPFHLKLMYDDPSKRWIFEVQRPVNQNLLLTFSILHDGQYYDVTVQMTSCLHYYSDRDDREMYMARITGWKRSGRFDIKLPDQKVISAISTPALPPFPNYRLFAKEVAARIKSFSDWAVTAGLAEAFIRYSIRHQRSETISTQESLRASIELLNELLTRCDTALAAKDIQQAYADDCVALAVMPMQYMMQHHLRKQLKKVNNNVRTSLPPDRGQAGVSSVAGEGLSGLHAVAGDP